MEDSREKIVWSGLETSPLYRGHFSARSMKRANGATCNTDTKTSTRSERNEKTVPEQIYIILGATLP